MTAQPDEVIEYPDGPPKERWRVKVNVPGVIRRLTLTRHETALAAEVSLALWREEVYGEIDQCRHELAWHTCATCLGLNSPYAYRQSIEDVRKLIGPGIQGRPFHLPKPAAARNLKGGYEPDAVVVADMVRRTTEEQGVPEKVTDPEVLDQVATLMGRKRWEDRWTGASR